ncbi:uncharacterized protein K452DRAFT_161006 [Aplosporella prunicola CBS 121167]|uniref:Uncharacterized protein n=1 Tax=Aplosporella prunicola CBS 121167 TaxID=1176127 RepID=A0A6A6BHU0_9PEZI|nr:uncharacterized protein K452DRAFT_161006 [Aplosporella prunicola CBS 121167]KAF2143690.1 hypothetical protein K452DRAFT_161006 [Aplosporella prunicola CBS 121167]
MRVTCKTVCVCVRVRVCVRVCVCVRSHNDSSLAQPLEQRQQQRQWQHDRFVPPRPGAKTPVRTFPPRRSRFVPSRGSHTLVPPGREPPLPTLILLYKHRMITCQPKRWRTQPTAARRRPSYHPSIHSSIHPSIRPSIPFAGVQDASCGLLIVEFVREAKEKERMPMTFFLFRASCPCRGSSGLEATPYVQSQTNWSRLRGEDEYDSCAPWRTQDQKLRRGHKPKKRIQIKKTKKRKKHKGTSALTH